ncbi:MAG: vitamin K epoxide reductase family protein [Actinomycetota bacterium]|nr:vitamin K epoxide reductase family protein [Actinomycetota bacterium]
MSLRGLGWRVSTTLLLSLAGLGLAGFLTWGHYFDQGAISNSCKGAFGAVSGGAIDCGAVTTSSWSMILGVPVALWGAIFFVFMVAINSPPAWRSPSIWVARLRLAASATGIAFVVYLVAVELLAVRKICIYCTGVHLIMFALFIVVTTGWADTGWSRFVAAYDAGQPEDEEEDGLEDEEDYTAVPVVSRKVPRAPRSERKRMGAGR